MASLGDLIIQTAVVGFSGWGIYCKWIAPRIHQRRLVNHNKPLLAQLLQAATAPPDSLPVSVPVSHETRQETAIESLQEPIAVSETVVFSVAETSTEPVTENVPSPEEADETDDDEEEKDYEEYDDEDWDEDEDEDEDEEAPVASSLPQKAVPMPSKSFRSYLAQSPENRDQQRWDEFKAAFLPNIIHMIAIGSSGAGKTIMLQDMVQTLLSQEQNVVVCDPDAAEGDWEGCEVYGAGDDFDAIAGVIGGLVTLMHERRVERAHGTRKFEPWWFVFDEFGEIVPECNGSAVVIGKALRRARKLNIHIVIGVQDTQVKTMGFERQSALLQNTRIVKVQLSDRGQRTLRYGEGESAQIRIPALKAPTPDQDEMPSSSSFKPVSLGESLPLDDDADDFIFGGDGEPTKRGGSRDGKEPMIMQLLEEGLSYNKIAAQLETSTARVARVKHKLDQLHSQHFGSNDNL